MGVIATTPPMKAINSENEEQKLIWAFTPVICSFDFPSSSPNAPAQGLADLGLILACYPLRC